MQLFDSLFNLIGVPIGWLFGLLYGWISNYFICIFLLTLLIRLILFPLSLKSQKSQCERAKLQPRLEHLQKKYGQNQKKLQEKTQEMYQKEGVSLTGGCLPMLIPMIVLMGFIFVVYSPLTYLSKTPTKVIDATVQAVTYTEVKGKETPASEKVDKISPADAKSQYYRQLNTLRVLEKNKTAVIAAIDKLDAETLNHKNGDFYFNKMMKLEDEFKFFGYTVLDKPWTTGKGFGDINLLWLIPLISGITAFLSMLLSMHYTKAMTSGQPGQGCSNAMMYIFMPGFSIYIAFIVPGAVGIYWICSNLIALLQTWVVNQIYNPAKIRAQAQIEYDERRRQRAEDKKRLAESRKREQAALAEENKKAAAGKDQKPAKKKPADKDKEGSDQPEEPSKTEQPDDDVTE